MDECVASSAVPTTVDHLLPPPARARVASARWPSRNRIVMAPMGDRLAHDDGTVSERQAAYLEARARGGVGLVLIGSVAVSYPAGAYAPCQTALSDDRFVPGLRARSPTGCTATARASVAQLVHDGANSLLDIAEGRPHAGAVDPAPPAARRPLGHGDAAELEAMIRPFTTPTSATRLPRGRRRRHRPGHRPVRGRRRPGPRRRPRRGRDPRRPRLPDRLVPLAGPQPARRRLGRRRRRPGPAPARGDRRGPRPRSATTSRCGAGSTPSSATARAARPPTTWSRSPTWPRPPAADAIHVSAATDAGAALGVTEAHTPHEPAPAAALRRPGHGPGVGAGHHRRAPRARRGRGGAWPTGDADFVAMGRKLLADPDLPNKLAAGRLDDVRPCIYQYRCIGNIFLNEPVGLRGQPGHRPRRRGRLSSRRPAPERVLVVGGGPAGLEAARAPRRAGPPGRAGRGRRRPGRHAAPGRPHRRHPRPVPPGSSAIVAAGSS